MIVLRDGGPTHYHVIIISSASLSDTDLQKRIGVVLTEVKLKVKPKRTSFVTEDGRRCEGLVIDFGDSLGMIHYPKDTVFLFRGRKLTIQMKESDFIARIRSLISDVEIRQYWYNNRFDSPEYLPQ